MTKTTLPNVGLTRRLHEGEIYYPQGNSYGRGVMVLHEAPGITGNVRRRCQDLAALGYIAFAPNLHHSATPLSSTEGLAAVSAFRADPLSLRRRVNESLDALCAEAKLIYSEIAVIGYCFGGMAALELARSGIEVALIASFHGLLDTLRPASSGDIHTQLLVCTGARDPFVSPEDVLRFWREMDKAGADWEMMIFGKAMHSFTNQTAHEFGDARLRYDARADAQSWESLKTLLGQTLR